MNYEKFFKTNNGKRVRAEMIDGDVIEGKLACHISDLDNDPDPESLLVRSNGVLIELYVPEILQVEVIE